jgi:hypothetical protein
MLAKLSCILTASRVYIGLEESKQRCDCSLRYITQAKEWIMSTVERAILWAGVIALAIFTLVINGAVNRLKTTVQEHTASLDKPILHATIFPGVPDALADRWSKVTKDKHPNPHYSGDVAADLSLLPRISDVYPYSASSWNTPKVVAGGKDQAMVQVTFPGLPQGEAHTLFLALQPEGITGPPYEAQAKRQWVDEYQLYWKKLAVTAVAQNATFEQYGLASAWTPVASK